jgi:hypothetical protein
MTANYNEIFRYAMIHHGYKAYRADMLIAEFQDKIRNDSDHESYRVLADAVEKVMGQVADPDRWDGDDSEEYILCRFLEWLPDLIAHQVCDKIRSQAVGGQYAADWADPFVKDPAGRWVRKSDGAPVPGLPEAG